jgi:hypothetical protein
VDEVRPPVPTEIRRRVLVEAGHRCAIPTCRYIEVDVHHVIPWAQCKSHDYENLIALCPNCHRRADSGDIDRKSLRLYKLNLRFAHDKFSQLELDLLFAAAKLPADEGVPWPPFMHILIKRVVVAPFAQGYGRVGAHQRGRLRGDWPSSTIPSQPSQPSQPS